VSGDVSGHWPGYETRLRPKGREPLWAKAREAWFPPPGGRSAGAGGFEEGPTMPVTDRNGVEIKVGAKAVNFARGLNHGLVGTVRAIKENCSVVRGKIGVRVSDGPEGFPNWSSRLRPDQVAVVP
jgi:hypothetical protein